MGTIYVASSRTEIADQLRIAYEYDCGLEIQIFSNPRILDDDWRSLLHKYRAMLKGFGGPLACHGAFYDLSPASMDARVVALTRDRYLLNLDIAAELEASPVVFHTNFFPMIRTEIYRRQWIDSQAEFWSEMGQEAAERGIEIAIENMWDPDPYVLCDLLEKIAVPNVACCMDISHVYLYGDDKGREIRNWLTVLEPYIIHVHINNTHGITDEHLALDVSGGSVDYGDILPTLARLKRNPGIVLEIPDPEALVKSLSFVKRALSSDVNE